MNDLDDYQRLTPYELANNEQALLSYIAELRRQRASFDAGVKPTKKIDKDSKADELIQKLKIKDAIPQNIERRRA